MAVIEVEYDEEYTMGLVEKIKKNYITEFIPEYFEMKYMRKLKLTNLPIQKEANEDSAAIKIQSWFKSDITREKLQKIRHLRYLKQQREIIVRRSTSKMI